MRGFRGSLIGIGALAAALLAAAPGTAQTPVPPSPSLASPPTREEVNRGQPTTPAPRASRLSVEGEIERAPCPLADPRFANVTVTLSAVNFNNLKVADPASLDPAWRDYVGKTVPIAAVCEIRDAAATILRRQGFLAAVQVPPQRIENGVVNLDVLMARLVGVQVRGDAGKSEALIASYLDKLVGQPAFNENDAERYLLLARDLPGYDVRLTLRPAGDTPGEVIGEVQVVRQPFTVDFNAQNYGSRDVGRFGGLLRAEAYDLLGLGDRLTLGYFATKDFEEQNVLQGGYEFRVGGEGLTVATRATYAWTKPDIGAGLDLESRTLVASGEVRYPFVRRQAVNLRGAGGLDYINQKVDFATLPLTRDRLRVAFLRVEGEALDKASISSRIGYSGAEPKWRLAGTLEVRRGLGILDASPGCGPGLVRCLAVGFVPPSRIEGDPTSTVVRFQGQAEYRPIPNLTFSLVPSAQYSRRPLFSYEEYSGGNYTVGRGYDPGSIIGDSGVGVQAEVRLGSTVPQRANDLAVQPFAFYDTAWVWNRDVAFDGLNPQRLASAGGGVRAAFGDRARLDVALAFPLKRATLTARRPDARLLVSLTTKLYPWTRR